MCLVSMSGALVFAVAAQGSPLDCLTLEARALTRSCNNQRDSPWQATTSRAMHRQHTETHPQHFHERGLPVAPGAAG